LCCQEPDNHDGRRSLEDFPYRGREGRIAGTHELVFSALPYIAVYRVKDDAVQVLRSSHIPRSAGLALIIANDEFHQRDVTGSLIPR